jgi:hypothetical protein
MDRYLARTNIDAQQTDEPIDPQTRVDNLFAPPPGDPGAHGIFDASAKPRSRQLWLTMHRAPLAGALMASLLAARRVAKRAP